MNELDAFLGTVMEQPYEMGPLLVWADCLQERGDPRGEFLALMPEIIAAIKALPSSPDATPRDRTSVVSQLRAGAQLRLFASLQSRYTPLSGGRTMGDLQTDLRSQQFVMAAVLHAAGLVTDHQLSARSQSAVLAYHDLLGTDDREAANAVYAAWSAGASMAAWDYWVAGETWTTDLSAIRWQINLAKWLGSSRNPLPTKVRRLLRIIHVSLPEMSPHV